METILSQSLTLEEQCEQSMLENFELDPAPPLHSISRLKYAALIVLVIGLPIWASNLESPKMQQAKNSTPIQQIEQARVNTPNLVEENFDYEEFMNRYPLRKPEKPPWVPFGKKESKRVEVVG